MKSPPHKQHGFRIFAHNPEVSGSNPLPATKSKPESVGLWIFVSPAHCGRHFFKNGGISYEPQLAGFVKTQSIAYLFGVNVYKVLDLPKPEPELMKLYNQFSHLQGQDRSKLALAIFEVERLLKEGDVQPVLQRPKI